jgi:hypothetical protein
VFIPSIIESLKNKHGIFVSIKTILQIIFLGKKIVCFKIAVWAIILALIGIILIIIVILKFLYNEPAQEPLWKTFTHFQWKDWLFTWEYSGSHIINLRPICNNCRCELSDNSSGQLFDRGLFYCPNCLSKYPGIYRNELGDVDKIICHKINSGEYKNEITIQRQTDN